MLKPSEVDVNIILDFFRLYNDSGNIVSSDVKDL